MRTLIATVLTILTALAATAHADSRTLVFGPVVLHENSRFELCANSHYAQDTVLVDASFVRLKDGRTIKRERELEPGRGGCFAVTHEQVGDDPVFAALETFGQFGDAAPVSASAIVNGIFDVPVPQLFIEDDGVPTATTFGPVQLPEGERMEVCASNWRRDYPVDVTVHFYRVSDSREPLATKSATLAPGRGTCASISQRQSRNARIFAELTTEPVEPGFSTFLPVRGAFIINGIYDAPLPPDLRYLPQR